VRKEGANIESEAETLRLGASARFSLDLTQVKERETLYSKDRRNTDFKTDTRATVDNVHPMIPKKMRHQLKREIQGSSFLKAHVPRGQKHRRPIIPKIRRLTPEHNSGTPTKTRHPKTDEQRHAVPSSKGWDE
jgi:hypothetical protein